MPDGSESDQTVARGMYTSSRHMSVSNAFAAHGMDLLAQMLAAGNQTAKAASIAAEAANLMAGISKLMWNGSAYCDGICAEVEGNSRIMSNIFGLAFGIVPDANIDFNWQAVSNWGLQQLGDYGAFWYQMALTSSYYGKYYPVLDDGTAIVTALAKCDRYSWCSGLRDDNLTMTRESWHDGTYSHGWGSSAIVGVVWGVLGVHQTAPAFATFLVKPKLGPLTNAQGTVPTLRGYINVTASVDGAVDVQVPCNSWATLCSSRSSSDGNLLRTTANFILLLDGKEEPAVSLGDGHLCMARAVGCGAQGGYRSLRMQQKK